MNQRCKQCGKIFPGKGIHCPDCLRKLVLAQAGMADIDDECIANRFIRLIAFLFDAAAVLFFALLIFRINPRSFELELGQGVVMTVARILKPVGGMAGYSLTGMAASAIAVLSAVSILGSIVGCFYYLLCEASLLRATPGKIVLGLTITNRDGDPPGFFRVLVRYVARFGFLIPLFALSYLAYNFPAYAIELRVPLSMFAAVLLLMTFLAYLFTPQAQGLHDLLSGCYVREVQVVSAFRTLLVVLAAFAVAFAISKFLLPKEAEVLFYPRLKFITPS